MTTLWTIAAKGHPALCSVAHWHMRQAGDDHFLDYKLANGVSGSLKLAAGAHVFVRLFHGPRRAPADKGDYAAKV